MAFKSPTVGEKLRAMKWNGERVLCSRCYHSTKHRPSSCADCDRAARRMAEVKAWLAKREGVRT